MPGPGQVMPVPSPGRISSPAGRAVTCAHTPPALTVAVTGCHWAGAIQNHSGRPTSASVPRGRAVSTSGSGRASSFCAQASSCWGVTAGAAAAPAGTMVLVAFRMLTPLRPPLSFSPCGQTRSIWSGFPAIGYSAHGVLTAPVVPARLAPAPGAPGAAVPVWQEMS